MTQKLNKGTNRSTCNKYGDEISKSFEDPMRLRDNSVEELSNSLVNFAVNAKFFNDNFLIPDKNSSINGSIEWHKLNSAPENSATRDNKGLSATPVASSSGATADSNGSDGRLASLSILHPPPPPVPPLPPRPSSSFFSRRHGNDSHVQLTTNDTATSFASEQGENKMRLHRNAYNRKSKGSDSGTYCNDNKNTSAAAATGKNVNVGIVGGGGNKIDNSRTMNRTMSRDGHFSTTTHLRSQGSGGLVGGLGEGGGRGNNEFLIDTLNPALLSSNSRTSRRSRSLSEAKTSLITAKATITHMANYDNGYIKSPVLVKPRPFRVTHSDDDSLERCNGDSGDSNAVGTSVTTTAFVKNMCKMRHGSLDMDSHHKPPPPPPSLHNQARRGSDSKLGETRGGDAGHKVTAKSGLKGTFQQVKRRLGKLDSKPENDGDDELIYGVGSNTRIHVCKTKVDKEPKKVRSQPRSQSTKNPQMPPEGRQMRTDNYNGVRENDGGNEIDNSRRMNRIMSRDRNFGANEQATTTHLRSQGSGGLVGGLGEGGGRGNNEFLIDNLSSALLWSNNRKSRRSRSLCEAKTSLITAKATITRMANYDNGYIRSLDLVKPRPFRVTHSDDDSLERCNGDSGDSNAVGTSVTTTAFAKKIRNMRNGSLEKDPHHKPPPSLHNHDLQQTPPPPPPRRDRGRRSARASSRGRPTPVSSVKGLADAENEQIEHQKHQGQRVLAKGVAVLTSLRSRSLSRTRSSSRQRAGSVGRPGSSRIASLARHEGPSASGDGDYGGALSSSEQGPMLSINQKNRIAGFLRGALPDTLKFDPKTGRCKKHPSIMLAKKSIFSNGWDILKIECPLCCEARKKHHRQDESGRGDADHHHKFNDSHTSLTYETNTAPVSATSTFATKTTEGGGEIEEHSRFTELTDLSFENSLAAAKDTSPVRVGRMPYTTPWGEVGWYTGMVNSHGIPNGLGRMRTKTGNIIEGKWTDGYSDDEKLGRRSGKMSGGFAPKSTPWNDDQRRGGGSAFWSASVPSVSPGQVTTVGMMSSRSPGGIYPYPASTQSQPLSSVHQHQEGAIAYCTQEKRMVCPSPGQMSSEGMLLFHSPGGSYPSPTFAQSHPLSGIQQHQAQMMFAPPKRNS